MSFSEGKSAETGAANAEEATADEEAPADEVAAADDIFATDADEVAAAADEEADRAADEGAEFKVVRSFHGSFCDDCNVCDVIFWANWANDSWPFTLLRAALFVPGVIVHTPFPLPSVRVNSLWMLRAWLMDLCHFEPSVCNLA